MSRILVVDDNAHIRLILRMALEGDAHEVIEAENGQEGLQYSQAQHIDLLVTDMDMPIMDGLEMISKLPQTLPLSRIIAISGGGHYLAMAKAVGVPHLFSKPFCVNLLLDTVQQVVTECEAPRELIAPATT